MGILFDKIDSFLKKAYKIESRALGMIPGLLASPWMVKVFPDEVAP